MSLLSTNLLSLDPVRLLSEPLVERGLGNQGDAIELAGVVLLLERRLGDQRGAIAAAAAELAGVVLGDQRGTIELTGVRLLLERGLGER